MSGSVHAGGCLCGDIRFELRGQPIVTGWCHCRTCQRAGGGPAALIAIFPRQAYHLLRGEPARRLSSQRGARHFCRRCGAQLFFEALERDDRWEVHAGAFDDPGFLRPRFHLFMDSRLPWMQPADGLKQFPGHRSPGYGEEENHG